MWGNLIKFSSEYFEGPIIPQCNRKAERVRLTLERELGQLWATYLQYREFPSCGECKQGLFCPSPSVGVCQMFFFLYC